MLIVIWECPVFKRASLEITMTVPLNLNLDCFILLQFSNSIQRIKLNIPEWGSGSRSNQIISLKNAGSSLDPVAGSILSRDLGFQYYNDASLKVQEKKVPTHAYVPNLTPSVRFGHKYYDQRLSNSSCAQSKYQLKKLFPTYY